MKEVISFVVQVRRLDESLSVNEVSFRVATPKDVVKIYRAIGYSFPNKSEGELISWILDIILNNGIIFLSEVSGRVVGAMCFEERQLLNNSESGKYLSSEWLYTHKAYKEKHISTAMTNMAKLYANEHNLIIELKSENGISEAINDVFFRFQGFEELGNIFVYRRNLIKK